MLFGATAVTILSSLAATSLGAAISTTTSNEVHPTPTPHVAARREGTSTVTLGHTTSVVVWGVGTPVAQPPPHRAARRQGGLTLTLDHTTVTADPAYQTTTPLAPRGIVGTPLYQSAPTSSLAPRGIVGTPLYQSAPTSHLAARSVTHLPPTPTTSIIIN